jgi:CubicO group peptidase (beta-lactamase class C family)
MEIRGGNVISLVRLAAAAAIVVSVALPAGAQGIPKAQSPEEVGFVASRLKRVSERLEEGVKNNELPGAVLLIARNGKIAMFDSFGFRDREAKVPMTNDTIFRITSMTKPIVSVAAIMLMEEGKLTLADPVSRYIPAFADTKVAVEKKKEDGTVEYVLEPQARAMTVQDLMRHTSGLTYGTPGANQIKQSYLDINVNDRKQTLAEMADKLAKLALLYQPGTTWEYSMSTDVLGRVVEVASGMPLDKFIEERITKPLKMGDTGFEVPADKKARGAKPMKEGPKNELPSIPDVTEKFTWRSGGGGMVSTASDYARFLQMFANGGQLDGVRLISRKSIDLMTADALPPDVKMGAGMQAFEALEPSARMGQGFGLGFAVRTEQGRNPLPGSPNDYYWVGAYGTYFWHDPRERMYVVFMMQSPAVRERGCQSSNKFLYGTDG